MRRRYAVVMCSVLFLLGRAAPALSGEAGLSPFAAPSVATRASASGPHLTLQTNRFTFGAGRVHALSAGLSTTSPETSDLYIVLRAPTGQFFSLLGSGAFVGGLVPFAPNVVLPHGFQFPIQALVLAELPNLPTGTYTWFGGLTVPGTLQLVSNLAHANWQFVGTIPAQVGDPETAVTLENGYRITFLGVTVHPDGTSTWRYRVEELPSAQDLSNWVLALPGCAVTLGASPEPWELVHPDPNAGLNGIKWQTGAGFHAGEFAFTLSEPWAVGATQVAAKGPDLAFGTIAGPICERPLELALDKMADRVTARPGDALAYTITLENVGTTLAEALVLTDLIPIGTTFVPGSLAVSAVHNGLPVPGGLVEFRPADNLVFWQGDVAPGQRVTIIFRATVNAGVGVGSTITNTAFAGPKEAAAVVDIIQVP